ncbi:hypothetical protein CDAR_573291 [Caerostris darwini]|uniref:RNase H type-1 domain-containing protein n=1 Tax=Caerostris darwini TaxID=1538125 RepID=A0AAV4M3C8_9ARAC|nr:hypothetical protein CDAR_573291 [Caerostris darwini]
MPSTARFYELLADEGGLTFLKSADNLPYDFGGQDWLIYLKENLSSFTITHSMGPSHVGLRENEEADYLANSVAIELITDHYALTFSEIFTLRIIAVNKLWVITTGTSERNLELLLLLKATDK